MVNNSKPREATDQELADLLDALDNTYSSQTREELIEDIESSFISVFDDYNMTGFGDGPNSLEGEVTKVMTLVYAGDPTEYRCYFWGDEGVTSVD